MKSSPKPAEPAAASPLSQAVDELGALEKRLLPFKADLARVEILRKAIRAQFDASPAAEPLEVKGERFTALLGPRGIERTINPAKLIKAIGVKVYATIARITLGDLEKNVDAGIVAAVVTSAHTGPRSLKTFERISK